MDEQIEREARKLRGLHGEGAPDIAADGAAGIKVLQSGAKIDLLITDVGLPNGMNGRQVADEARRLRPGLRVLFIKGFAENAAVGNGYLETGMELLTKPFTLESLSVKVAEILSSALYDYVAQHSAFAMRTRRAEGIICGSRCGGECELMSPTQS